MVGMTRALLGAVVALAFAAASCTASDPPTEDGTPSGLITPSPQARNATEAPGLPVDRYELPEVDVEGFEALLGELKGVPVVVNVWASWCAPCRKEGPGLTEAALRFGDRVQFLGVDICDNRTEARIFIRDMGWPYPSVYAPEGPCGTGAFLTHYGYLGPPVTLFYGADGTLVNDHAGPISEEALLEEVQRLL